MSLGMLPRQYSQQFAMAVAVTAWFMACGDNTAGPLAPDAKPTDIVERLKRIANLQFEEVTSELPGYRVFSLSLELPVDPANPDGQKFQSHGTLAHRDLAAPTMLAATGYSDYLGARLYDVSAATRANQLSLEHRFFGPSTPNPADWTKLTIANAASDHHAWASAMRSVYDGKLATIGASKGGMTSVYHARFFPGDVDATIAYVAPLSFSDRDSRYSAFLSSLGEATCRNAIIALQRELLTNRRAMLEQRATAEATAKGFSYSRIAIAPSVEVAAGSLDFYFWQYRGLRFCPTVPSLVASDDALWQFVNSVAPISDSSDESLQQFDSYYYQAAFELGGPELFSPALAPLLQFDDEVYAKLLPVGVPAPTYSPTAMQDIDSFVQQSGQRLLFVYGELDPWTAGAFRLGSAQDSLSLQVAGGTHGANVAALAASDRQVASAALERWLGVAPVFANRKPLNEPGAQLLDAAAPLQRIPAAVVRAVRTIRARAVLRQPSE